MSCDAIYIIRPWAHGSPWEKRVFCSRRQNYAFLHVCLQTMVLIDENLRYTQSYILRVNGVFKIPWLRWSSFYRVSTKIVVHLKMLTTIFFLLGVYKSI